MQTSLLWSRSFDRSDRALSKQGFSLEPAADAIPPYTRNFGSSDRLGSVTVDAAGEAKGSAPQGPRRYNSNISTKICQLMSESSAGS